ncbi:MAG: VapC toxin family PIN domain ribonuclease [Actinomycetes bacterium]
MTCPPQVLEFCHSARTSEEHARYRERISLGFPLQRAPDESLVLGLQAALGGAGLVRAAGAIDLLIAGYAIVNDATVLAADHDFDHMARMSELRHEYVAPSG